MKIAYTNSIFFTQKYGGISRYFCSLIKELIDKKVSVKVFSPIFKNNYLLNLPKINRQGIFIPRYPTPKYLKNIIDKISYFQIQNSKCEIVHDTYYSKEILNFKNKKKVITVYDLIHEKFHKLYKNNNLDLKKKIINEADAIICISNNTKKDLIEYYRPDEKKIFVVHLGYDHIENDSLDSGHNKIKIPENFILFVGSRLKYKNFQLFIKSYALKKIINDNFDVICFGGGNFSKNEKSLFSELAINNKIHYLQGNDDFLSYLYLKAKLFIFPSQYEGFGIPLIEAMSVGCPVLASNINIFNEICESGIHYFSNNDQKDLIEKLEYLLSSDKNLLSKVNLAKNISKKYTWEKCATETYEVYNKL